MRDEKGNLIEPYNLHEAAEFVSQISWPITARGLEKHIYETGQLKADRRLGRRIAFSKLALITFVNQRQRRGAASRNYRPTQKKKRVRQDLPKRGE